MKKTGYLVFTFLVISPAIGYSINLEELESFKAIGALYEQSAHSSLPLAEARSFLKKYPESPYAARVNYIIAMCLGNTPEAVSQYNHIIQTHAARKSRGAPDVSVENNAIAVSAAYRIAEIYFNRHSYDEARSRLEFLNARFSNSFLEGERLYGLMQVDLASDRWPEAEATLKQLMLTDPYYLKDQRVLYAAGLILFNKNEFEKAYEKFQHVTDVEGLYYQALCLNKLKKYLPAVTVFRRLLADFSANPLREEVRYLIADCYYQAEDYDVALAEYNAFLKEFPQSILSARAMYQKGFCSIRKKDFNTALVVLKDLIRRYPANSYAPLAQSLIAQALTEQGQYDAALTAYTVLISSYPDSYCVPEGYYKMGWCYFNLKKYSAAIASCKEMVKRFPRNELVPDALFLIAENDRRLANFEEAVSCYEQIIRSSIATPAKIESALFMLAKTYSEQKRYKDVVSTYHYIVNNFAADSSPWRPYTLLRIAEAYYYLGIYADAERLYNSIIGRYPFTKAANLAIEGKSWVYFQQKEYALAKNERESLMDSVAVLSSSATKISSEFEMGNICFNQRDYAGALEYFENFSAEHPDDALVPDALFNAGRCYYKLEYYSKAIQKWEELIAGYKSHPRAREAVGIIADTYFRAQKYPEAIKAYQRALTDFPGTDMAREAQLRIAQSYLNANDNLTAIAEFEKFIRQYGNDPLTKTALDGIIIASYKLGQSSTEGDIDIQVMQRLLEKYPGTKFAADVQYRLAERYYEKKDFPRAAAVFKQAYTNFYSGENAARALFFLAESLYQNAQYEEAVAGYRRFIDNYPQDENISLSYLHLANALYYLKRYEDAGKVYVSLTRLTPVDDELAVTALHNAAVCFRKLENWDQVVLINKRFLELFPKSDKVNDVLMELAETYESLTQNDMAIGTYQQLMNTLPANDPLIPELHYRIAELYYKAANPDKGNEELQKIISLEPKDNPWRLTGMAKLAQEYERAKDLQRAADVYRRLINSTNEAKWISVAQQRIAVIENQQRMIEENNK